MAVKAIRVKNFMAFEDTGWVELRPVTLLFGRNSSGKSVIIRALRLLKQSLEHSPSGSPFAYRAENGVDVGSFFDMAYGQERTPYENCEKKISFGFRCAVAEEMMSYLNIDTDQNPWINLTLDFGWRAEEKRVILTSLAFEAATGFIFTAERMPESRWEWLFYSDFLKEYEKEDQPNIWPYAEVRLQAAFLPSLMLAKDNIVPDERNDDFEFIKEIFQYFRTEIGSFLKHIEYMQPTRPKPRRLYMLNDDEQQRWEQQGLGGFLNLLRMKLDEEQLNRLNYWLEKLKFAKRIELESFSKLPELAPITGLFLDEGEEGHSKVNLADVGFGNSQVLPVIIQSIVAEPKSLVIIEQPELHLHPRAQAELADLFVEMARHNVHFLIETHSEHLLLRLRRWTTEHTTGKSVLSDDKKFLKWGESVAYFIHRRNNVSSIDRIGIDAYGDLENIPEGFEEFFSDDLLESLELTKLQLTSENAWDSDDEPDN